VNSVTLGTTLQRRKFPANERVHITEKIFFSNTSNFSFLTEFAKKDFFSLPGFSFSSYYFTRNFELFQVFFTPVL